jgi:hypothetical protein
MPPRKIPEAEDRGEAVIRNPDADVINLDAERSKRAQMTPDTNANNDPAEPGSEGGGAQNDPI